MDWATTRSTYFPFIVAAGGKALSFSPVLSGHCEESTYVSNTETFNPPSKYSPSANWARAT
ncbi:hypothetical protein D3C81_1562890 [compost metagenome]